MTGHPFEKVLSESPVEPHPVVKRSSLAASTVMRPQATLVPPQSEGMMAREIAAAFEAKTRSRVSGLRPRLPSGPPASFAAQGPPRIFQEAVAHPKKQ